MKNRFQNHQQLNNIVINAQAKNCELQKMQLNQNRTTVKQRKKEKSLISDYWFWFPRMCTCGRKVLIILATSVLTNKEPYYI